MMYTFKKLLPSDKLEFEQFYNNIMQKCFLDSDELASMQSFDRYLSAEKLHNVSLMYDENQNIIGGAIYNYFERSDSGVIEYIAINPDLQLKGLGKLLYEHVLTVLYGVDYILCEIDSPETTMQAGKNYLYFWRSLGFRRIKCNYVQPALSNSQHPVTTLNLIVNKNADQESILSTVYDYYKFGMHIEYPEEIEEYQNLQRELTEVILEDI